MRRLVMAIGGSALLLLTIACSGNPAPRVHEGIQRDVLPATIEYGVPLSNGKCRVSFGGATSPPIECRNFQGRDGWQYMVLYKSGDPHVAFRVHPSDGHLPVWFSTEFRRFMEENGYLQPQRSSGPEA